LYIGFSASLHASIDDFAVPTELLVCLHFVAE
jgi:hypothetical protein